MDLGIYYIECPNCGEVHSPGEDVNPGRAKEYRFKHAVTGNDIDVINDYSEIVKHKPKLSKRILKEVFGKDLPLPSDKPLKHSVSVAVSTVEVDGKRVVIRCPECGAVQLEIKR